MRLGIIAGNGELPKSIAKAAFEKNIPIVTICIKNFASKDDFQAYGEAIELPLGKVGSAVKYLKKNNISHITIGGSIKRPSLFSLKPDFEGSKLLTKILTKKFLGDDDLMKEIAKFMELWGMILIPNSDIVNLSCNTIGPVTAISPDENQFQDINVGIETAKIIGNLDIGQAVIVSERRVIAVEGAEGTDNMIKRSKEYIAKGQHACLVKMSKPNQDLRLDLPTIGLNTLFNCHENGITGIAIEKDKVNVIECQKIIDLADKLGMYIYVFE